MKTQLLQILTLLLLTVCSPNNIGKEKRKILGQIGAGVDGMISTYPKLISKILETMASASPYSGLKSPIPNEYNIGQVLICSIALSPI